MMIAPSTSCSSTNSCNISDNTHNRKSGRRGPSRKEWSQNGQQQSWPKGIRRLMQASDDNTPCPRASQAREQAHRSIRGWIRQQQQPPNQQQDTLNRVHLGTNRDPGIPDTIIHRRRSGFQRLHQLISSHRMRRTGGQDQELPPPIAESPRQMQLRLQPSETTHGSCRKEATPSNPLTSMNLPGTRRSTTNLLDDDDSDDDIQEQLFMAPGDAARPRASRETVVTTHVPSRNETRPLNPSVAMTLQGTRRSTTSLLDDDSDDDIQEQFVQCLKSARISPYVETTEADSYAHHVVDSFPDVHPDRIMDLLRRKSLTSALIILAEESSVKPSNQLACRTELKPATTYAQASDDDRTRMLSYLMEMFPQIPASDIESTLMQHSMHQGVSILSSHTTMTMEPPPVVSLPPNENPSLDEGDEWEPNDRILR